MKPKTIALAVAGGILAIILLVAVFSVGIFLGNRLIDQNDDLPTIEEVSNDAGTPNGLELIFTPFWEVWELVHTSYVDQPVDDEALMQGAVNGMLEAVDEQTADSPELNALEDALMEPASEGGTPEDIQELFAPFWHTWDLIHTEYEEPAINDILLVQGAINGMLATLGDQHTRYFTPREYQQSTANISGEYEGIGAWVDPTGDYLAIISPIPGSPAEEVGLQPGDLIIAVDGEDMTGVDGDLVIQQVLGPAGSVVVLTIQREGVAEPFDVEVTRGTITIPAVEYEMLEDNIAYVQLFNFGDKATDQLRAALEDLLSQDPDGLILDLRGNGGGWLQVAIQITSEFIGEDVLMYEQYGDGTQDVYNAQEGGLATDIPLVVLVNGGTASASEILAGAVQDYERGTLVGTLTFGKGSVQQQWPLSDGGAIRVTVARWLTPDERHIHGVGITPDYEVPFTEEDMIAGRDPQLDKAIEILLDQ